MLNIEKIDIACNYSKLKYSVIDYFMNTNKTGTIGPNEKVIVMYDMAYTLSFMEGISGLSKESGYSDKLEDEKTIIRLVYGILNSIAHYRYYITSKIKRNSVVILYSSESSYYIRYERTFTMINKILNLFRKTIFIERLEDEIKFIYQHVAYFTAMNIVSLNLSAGDRRCRIMYIGNNELALQMLRIDRDMISIKHGYIDCGTDIAFKSESLHLDEVSLAFDGKNVDLIIPMLSIFGFKHGYPKLESVKHKKNLSIYSVICNNCKSSVDKDNPSSIVTGLNLTKSDEELFGFRLKTLDVDFHNKTFILSKTLLKIWSSKIQTGSLHSFNDFFEFDDMRLNVQWLMG